MKISRRNLLVLLSGMVAASASTPALAAANIVNVSLWDKGPSPMDMLGKGKMMGFFVGQVMKLSKGKANPAQVNELIRQKMKE